MQQGLLKKEMVIGMILIMVCGIFSSTTVGEQQTAVPTDCFRNIPCDILHLDKRTISEPGNIHFAITQSRCIDSIIEMINQINETLINYYLKGLVDIGPRYIDTKNCKIAANYIYDEFQKLGLEVYLDNWSYKRFTSSNVIATEKGGNSSSNAVVILCAHYDTRRGSPGADDDGSGIAAILAIANISRHYVFNHTIKFLALSGEEIGMGGSRDYARKAYDHGENIIAVLNLDSIGSAITETGGKTILAFTPDRARWIPLFMQNISDQYSDYIGLAVQTMPNHPCDQEPFNGYGYDGVMIVQFDPLVNVNSPNDTIDKINLTYLTKIAKLTLAVTSSLAQKPIDLQVRFITPKRGVFYIFDTPVFKQPKYFNSLEQIGMTYIFGRCIARLNVTTSNDIERVLFGVDGLFFLTKIPSTKLEWKIQGYDTPLLGRYTIEAYVYTVNGNVAHDEIDIFIVTLSHLYW